MKSGLQSRTGFRTPSPEGGAVRRAAVSASPERFRRHPAEGRTPDAVPEPQECSPLSETPASAGAFVLRRLKTGRALLCAAALLWLMQAAAQSPQASSSPQFSLGASAVDSVPQTTVVPVQQQPVQLVEHTTVYEDPARGMTRPERRAYRARLYAQKIDSLVQSRDYMFFPNSMQEIPGGLIRSIYADYFFFGMFVDHVEPRKAAPFFYSPIRFGSAFGDQCHGRDGNPLLAPFETEMLCGRSFDRHPVIAYAHCTGHCGAHRVDMGPELGPLHPDRTIDIPDFVSPFAQQRSNPAEQNFRIYSREVVRRVGEVQPDVAQRRGAQQRVAYGVYRHVAVRMRDASFRMGNLDSAQYQPQAVRQRMHVVSVSYPEIGHMLSVFLRKDNRTGM